jgi:hypothetical protein
LEFSVYSNDKIFILGDVLTRLLLRWYPLLLRWYLLLLRWYLLLLRWYLLPMRWYLQLLRWYLLLLRWEKSAPFLSCSWIFLGGIN